MSVLNDVLTLAKAGYKASEIRDLLKEQPEPKPEPLPDPKPEPLPEPIQEVKPEDSKPKIAEDVPTPAKATEQQTETVESEKIKELENKIETLQKQNQSKDISGQVPDPQKELDDIVRSFM